MKPPRPRGALPRVVANGSMGKPLVFEADATVLEPMKWKHFSSMKKKVCAENEIFRDQKPWLQEGMCADAGPWARWGWGTKAKEGRWGRDRSRSAVCRGFSDEPRLPAAHSTVFQIQSIICWRVYRGTTKHLFYFRVCKYQSKRLFLLYGHTSYVVEACNSKTPYRLTFLIFTTVYSS